jgi:hypothetical protein
MRVTMLGHACLLCETADSRILMDPWLSGPANFRSWWHFPEVKCDLSALPQLDYLYVSHLHDDHFHAATLKQLDKHAVVLIPRLYHKRLVEGLRIFGYDRIIELPHAQRVNLDGSTWVCCVQTGNDSLLVVGDASATMLNANDALQGNDPTITMPLLNGLANRYSFDIAFMAFGTAGAFPKCYRFEDPREAMDPWVKERAMINSFVRGALAAKAKAVVPFAGGFALLENRLMWMNDAKSTPRDAVDALKAKNATQQTYEMNPGDIWDNREGMKQIHPTIDWGTKHAMIENLRQVHSQELADIEFDDRQGPADLFGMFQQRLTRNLRSFPRLRQRMNCAVLFKVEGCPGGQWEVDLRGSQPIFRQGDSGDWEIRITLPSRLLAEVLTDPDGWETLGISYKLEMFLRKGARAKEGLLNRLMQTPSPLMLVRLLLAPRFAEFVFRRRVEFAQLCRQKLLSTS